MPERENLVKAAESGTQHLEMLLHLVWAAPSQPHHAFNTVVTSPVPVGASAHHVHGRCLPSPWLTYSRSR